MAKHIHVLMLPGTYILIDNPNDFETNECVPSLE